MLHLSENFIVIIKIKYKIIQLNINFENKFKATPKLIFFTPKLILFYPKINSLTPNEKPPQNYFFFPQKYFIFYPKNIFSTPNKMKCKK